MNGNGSGNPNPVSGGASIPAEGNVGGNPQHVEAVQERPASSPAAAELAPLREPPAARAPEAAPSNPAADKYVVWSSVPTDVPRSGPDER